MLIYRDRGYLMRETKCSVDGCEKKGAGRGWCQMHYRRWRRHGDVHAVHVKQPGDRRCEIPDCERKHLGNGLCEMHYHRWRKRGIRPSVEAVREHELTEARETFERWEATQ